MTPWLIVFTVLAATPPDTMIVPLPEVTVTGSRVPESAQRTPAAISVVDRRSFRDTRGNSLKDALDRIPGVLVQSRAGAQDVRVTIRGFGARGNGERSNAGSMRGVRVMTDGLPVTEPDGRTSLDLVDLGTADRVEIVRSNSSTLYGNASGGVVHLRTNLGFEEPYGELLERAGSFGFHREQGAVGMTIGRARGVVTLFNSTFEGWREHSSSTVTQGAARFALPLDERTRLGILLDAVSDLHRFPGALTQAQLDADPEQASATYLSRDERRRNRVGRIGLTLDRGLATNQDLALNLFVEPKVLQRSERGRFRDFNRYHLGSSATYQLHSTLGPGIAGRTMIGGDEAYQDGSILFYGLNPDGSRATNVIANKREAANGLGGFLEQDLTWNERWSVRLAGRWDQLMYLSEDHIDPQLDADKTFRRFTPKGSLSYALDHHTVYAALGGGVEAPAFNEIDPPAPFDTLTSLNPFLDAMYSTTYEVGAKGQLVSASRWGSLRYDAALYWIRVQNEVVPFGGGAFFRTAGESRRRGVELGLSWLPVETLTLDGAVTVSDNEYVEYQNDVGDFGGNETPGLPSLAASGRAHVRLPAGLEVGASAEHIGDYFADDTNEAEAPAYTLFGASLAWERGPLRAFVAGENLTDEAYVASVFINGVRSNPSDVLTGQYFEPGLPRNWSAGLTLRWH